MKKLFCDVTGILIELEQDAYTIEVKKASGKAGMPTLTVHPSVVSDLKKWLYRSK